MRLFWGVEMSCFWMNYGLEPGNMSYDSVLAFGMVQNRCITVVGGSAFSTGEPRLSILYLQLGMPRFQLENEGTHYVLLDLPIIEQSI